MSLPKHIQSLMDGRPAVARQYEPDPAESRVLPGELADPIGDNAHSPVKGVVHRYPDRILLKVTDTCDIYCRFCFRKEMVGKGEGMLSPAEMEVALSYIRACPLVREVILSGGDPLTLSNRRLKDLFAALEAIPTLDIIRIHTRAPLVRPQRVDEELVDVLSGVEKALYIVVHINSAEELDEAVRAGLRRLRASGAVLLSQSVLLKGVNDSVAALEELFRALIANRIKPYYLHHPDMAPGTSHFRVNLARGQELMRSLRGRLSGIALPTYVLDIPGGHGKMPVGPSYLEELEPGRYRIEDYQGQPHLYPPDGT